MPETDKADGRLLKHLMINYVFTNVFANYTNMQRLYTNHYYYSEHLKKELKLNEIILVFLVDTIKQIVY